MSKISEDGLIQIHIGSHVSDIIFQPADWSIVNLPVNKQEARLLSKHLFNMPVSQHVVLALARHSRKNKITALSNLSAFQHNKRWKFLDQVSLSYGKPSACSNNGFLPVCEPGFLMYKGDIPDTKSTGWASDVYKNATNEWVLMPNDEENQVFKNTYHSVFCWELGFLMKSLSGVVECGSFVYGFKPSGTELRSLHLFCKKMNLKAQLVARSDEEAQEMINQSLSEG